MIIYKITNKNNGMCYIGQTIRSLSERWKNHRTLKSGCIRLNNAIRKYGKDSFSVEEIASYNTQEDLNDAEEYYIDFHNCLAPNGYNLKTGGSKGKMSEESKIKMSNSHIGQIPSAETLKKRSESMIGKNIGKNNGRFGTHWSQEEKQNRSKLMSGNSHPQFGRSKSKETKAKISASRKGKPAWNKGKPMSEESKAKLSISQKARLISKSLHDI
jgi:group I intron endonuclease